MNRYRNRNIEGLTSGQVAAGYVGYKTGQYISDRNKSNEKGSATPAIFGLIMVSCCCLIYLAILSNQ